MWLLCVLCMGSWHVGGDMCCLHCQWPAMPLLLHLRACEGCVIQGDEVGQQLANVLPK